LASGSKVLRSGLVLASKCGLTARCTRVNGAMTKLTVLDDSSTQTETSTRENGRTIKPMAKECIGILMGPSTRVNGVRTNSTAKVRSHGQTLQCTRVTIAMDRSMVRADLHGLTTPATRASS
jgi:hypothetical protein